jgi:acyl dehydratase
MQSANANVVRSGSGRRPADFEVGTPTQRPWEVDAMPLYSSASLARGSGFVDRPIHPLSALHLTLAASVREVGDAGARLSLVEVRFPEAGYAGDALSSRTSIVAADHVRTMLVTDRGRVLCALERKGLPPADLLSSKTPLDFTELRHLAPQLAGADVWRRGPRQFGRTFGDFAAGQVYLHEGRRTVGALHDSRAIADVLVLGWTLALGSQDLAANALWDLGIKDAVVRGTLAAGDTLYAASQVVGVRDAGAFGAVTVRVVGVQNRTAADAFDDHGEALFGDADLDDKIVDVTRTLAVRKR